MNKTVEIGLFFFFIHILVCSDSKIVLKHILGSEFCKYIGGGGRLGEYISPDPPPPRIVYTVDCVVRLDPPLA